MTDVRSRLAGCFSAVFPHLAAREVPQASTTSVDRWDSLATANLLAVVEEEFGIQVAPEDLGRFVSFEAIQDYLRSRGDVD